MLQPVAATISAIVAAIGCSVNCYFLATVVSDKTHDEVLTVETSNSAHSSFLC